MNRFATHLRSTRSACFLVIMAAIVSAQCQRALAANQPTTAPAGVMRQPGDLMDLIVIDAATKKPIEGLAIITVGAPDRFKGATRTNGHCDVPLPFQKFDPYFVITIRGKGYASQRLVWSGRNSTPEDVPDQFTVEMDKAARVSGAVVDDTGKPVSGASVSLAFIQKFKDPHEHLDIGGSASVVTVTTGADGHWEYAGAPPKCDEIRIAVNAGALAGPPNRDEMPPFKPQEELYDGTAKLTLTKR